MSDRDEIREQFLRWRHVKDPCEMCMGAGQKSYSTTSTWRGGIGGQSTEIDVCDRCWGTGDRYRRGVDLRAHRDEEQERIHRAAGELLARSVGAGLSTTRTDIMTISDAVRKLGAKRGGTIWLTSLCESLADTLARVAKS